MNSLEFINKIIKNSEESIKENKRVIKNFLLQDDIEKDSAIMTLESNIKFYNERLQILYKIKSELEAWEVVKPRIRIKEIADNGNFSKDYYRKYWTCHEKGVRVQEQVEKIEKALEVKDEI